MLPVAKADKPLLMAAFRDGTGADEWQKVARRRTAELYGLADSRMSTKRLAARYNRQTREAAVPPDDRCRTYTFHAPAAIQVEARFLMGWLKQHGKFGMQSIQ